MSESLDFNPALPESRQFTPPAEGGTATSISLAIITTLSGKPAVALRKAGSWNLSRPLKRFSNRGRRA